MENEVIKVAEEAVEAAAKNADTIAKVGEKVIIFTAGLFSGVAGTLGIQKLKKNKPLKKKAKKVKAKAEEIVEEVNAEIVSTDK